MSRISHHDFRRQLAVVSRLVLLAVLTAAMLTGCDALFGKSAQEHYQAAQEYAAAGNLRASVIELKNALQKDSQHAEARLLLGSLYLDLGDAASAAKELQRARQLGVAEDRVGLSLLLARLALAEYREVLDALAEMPDHGEDADLLVMAGRAYIGLGDYSAAESAFTRAIAIEASSGDAYVGLARLAAIRGQEDATKHYVEQALRADPGNADAWLLKGELAFVEKRFEDSKTAFENAKSHLGFNDLAARLALARVALAQNEPEQALEHVNAALRLAPNLPLAQYLRGVSNYQKGDISESEAAFYKVLKAAPDHLPSMFMMGSVQYARGNLEQAEDLLMRFLVRVPDHALARKLLAQVRLARERPGDAIETLAPILQTSARDPQLLALMGTAYMRGGEPSKARDYFQRAAAIRPQSAGLRTQLALSHLASGATESAISELERIVEQQGDALRAKALLVTALLRAREFDKALAAADDLVRQRPDEPLAYNLRGAVHLGRQDLQAARTDFERALKVDPEFTPAIFNLGQLDLAGGDKPSARQRYEAVLAVHADDPASLVALAKMESDAGNQAEAVRLLELAREKNPNAIQPRLVLANYYLQTRRFQEALSAASEAEQILPDNPLTLLFLGRAQLGTGKPAEAGERLGRVVDLRPKWAEARFYLAEARVAGGQWDAARASYKKALELSERKHMGSLAGLARLELRAGNTEAAREIAAELQHRFPDDAVGYEVEGDILAGANQYGSAAEAYRSALQRAQSSRVTLKLAGMQRRAGDASGADATLTDWLAKNPHDALVRLGLASAYQMAGKLTEATAQYERLVNDQPKHPIALNNLAWLYYEVGDPRALEMAEAALQVAPDSPAIMDTAGWLRVQAGQVERGLELLYRAAAGLPESAEVQYHLGAALAKSGDAKNARKHLEAALASGQSFAGRGETEELLKDL